MHAFLEKLRDRGIDVSREYDFSVFVPDSLSACMVRWERPVQDVLNQVMKESDNLSAEALFCRLGAQATGKRYVSAKEGIAEIKRMIKQLLGMEILYITKLKSRLRQVMNFLFLFK